MPRSTQSGGCESKGCVGCEVVSAEPRNAEAACALDPHGREEQSSAETEALDREIEGCPFADRS